MAIEETLSRIYTYILLFKNFSTLVVLKFQSFEILYVSIFKCFDYSNNSEQ